MVGKLPVDQEPTPTSTRTVNVFYKVRKLQVLTFTPLSFRVCLRIFLPKKGLLRFFYSHVYSIELLELRPLVRPPDSFYSRVRGEWTVDKPPGPRSTRRRDPGVGVTLQSGRTTGSGPVEGYGGLSHPSSVGKGLKGRWRSSSSSQTPRPSRRKRLGFSDT